ncbi:PDT-domain-containing protein [Coprinellus micaceus]|uniref:PDT-domain-containing protein n=1 Tax=Coprinellus micaceus TaxID=71717 RepID=A0A4Y7TZ45_COPMI|nr:PDT-domain-containing protein [Coprinellus micaceus]
MQLKPSERSSLAKVGVLGPFGTYSHEAAHNYFGNNVHYDEMKTIRAVFDSLAAGKLDYGVVPQENSIFGSVVETYDSLRCAAGTFVRGETSLRIDHCLLARKGVALGDVKTVLSHEQVRICPGRSDLSALGQCKEFVECHLPHASTEKTTSTAAAARALLDRPPTCAAISSRLCITLYEGLEVLNEAIQKEKVNYTRFFVLARDRDIEAPPAPPRLTNSRRKALFRILNKALRSTSSPNTGITAVLRGLPDDLEISRIDRRPAIGEVPFRDAYLIEVQSQMSSDAVVGEADWEELIEYFSNRVRGLGLSIDLVGNW